MVIGIITKVDYGRDLEKTLAVYTQARGMFINLDAVTLSLINQVLTLAMRCNQIVKGQHTEKTQTFVKSCIAYAHITIPSIEST